MKFFTNSSLQVKLLLLLVALPVIFLVIYLMFVFNLFKKDKIAYVYESGVSVSRTLSAQVKSEINSLTSELKPIMEGYNKETFEFDKLSQRIFDESKIVTEIIIYSLATDQYEKKTQLIKKEAYHFYENQLDALKANNIMISEAELLGHIWLQMYDRNSKIAVLALVKSEDLINVFSTEGLYSNHLIKQDGTPIFKSDDNMLYRTFSNWDFIKKKDSFLWQEGSFETISPDNNEMLLSFSKVGLGNLIVVSLINMDKAQSAIKILLKKSILFFVALISLAVIISFYASNKATLSLRELSSATEKISQGEFDIQLKQRSKDEVGKLAERFNQMAQRILVLLGETAEKARMETELKTAQAVQETLFPAPNMQIGDIAISGYYTPASECGGDWWSYNEIGDHVYFWIGDATGHGASAALITSAAKASVEIIKELSPTGPAEALSLLNKAIYNTSKGKICMTFFVGAIHKKTKEFTYANSGHEPPLLINRANSPFKPKELNPLLDANGPRLGDGPDSIYREKSIQLKKNDLILVYTDGVVDLEGSEGKTWGERKFLKTFADATNESKDIKAIVETITLEASSFRNNTPLRDDVTFFVCEIM